MNDTATAALNDRIAEHLRLALARVSVPARRPSEICATDALAGTLNVDSLGFLEILIDVENTFGIVFDDDYTSIAAYSTVQSLVDYVVQAAAPAGTGRGA